MSAVCADAFAAPQRGLRAETTARPRSAATTGQGSGLSCYWTLDAGRAVTLQSPQAGVLHVAQGQLWLTFQHAAQDASERGGDHFLGIGESLRLSRGDNVVVEAYGPNPAATACFSWAPAP